MRCGWHYLSRSGLVWVVDPVPSYPFSMAYTWCWNTSQCQSAGRRLVCIVQIVSPRKARPPSSPSVWLLLPRDRQISSSIIVSLRLLDGVFFRNFLCIVFRFKRNPNTSYRKVPVSFEDETYRQIRGKMILCIGVDWRTWDRSMVFGWQYHTGNLERSGKGEKNGTRERIRTFDLQLRRLSLYPAELHAHCLPGICPQHRLQINLPDSIQTVNRFP